MMVKIDPTRTLDLVKEIFWLAWQACGGTLGSGWIQDNPDANKEAVWTNIQNRGDYPGANRDKLGMASADYVFGRMMKLYVTYDEKAGTVEIPRDDAPTIDYQAWCGKYPTYGNLIEMAVASLGIEAIDVD